MSKKLLSFTICIILIVVSAPIALADTVSLYANIDDSNTYCNILIDIMRNDQLYDPYNEFVVVRAGEYDYRCYFGSDLSGNGLVCYRYTPSSYGNPANISRNVVENLTIRNNGYYYVGNVAGSLASAQAEDYKLGAIITVGAIVIIFLILFKIFRKSEGKKTKYFSVR